MKKVSLVPSILVKNFTEFKKKLEILEPYFQLVQLDVMDGKFVDNKVFADYKKIKSLKPKVDFELHLMIYNPIKIIKVWEKYKKVKRIIFHYEALKDSQEIIELIKYIKSKKIQVGLAINPETKVEKLYDFVGMVDVAFLMAVNPGWGAQKLKVSALTKAKKLRKKYPNLNIEIDGGVSLNNLDKVIKSGVNIVSAGSMIFKNINKIKKIKL